MRRPLNGAINITQAFGVKDKAYRLGYHTGTDYACGVGTPIYAPEAGYLTSGDGQARSDGRGYFIIIQGTSGTQHCLYHLSEFEVTSGQVSEGQLVGYSGDTGIVTGPHLHWETRLSPYNFVDAYDPESNDFSPKYLFDVTPIASKKIIIKVPNHWQLNSSRGWDLTPANQINVGDIYSVNSIASHVNGGEYYRLNWDTGVNTVDVEDYVDPQPTAVQPVIESPEVEPVITPTAPTSVVIPVVPPVVENNSPTIVQSEKTAEGIRWLQSLILGGGISTFPAMLIKYYSDKHSLNLTDEQILTVQSIIWVQLAALIRLIDLNIHLSDKGIFKSMNGFLYKVKKSNQL